MADHVRKQIRDAAEVLLTGLTTTGSRVHNQRVYGLDGDDDLPALLIYTNNEDIEETSITVNRRVRQERELELVVDGIARAAPGTLEATLDAIIAEVEVAIFADPTFGGLAKESELDTIEVDDDDDGDKPHGAVRLTFLVHYDTEAGVPDVAA